MGAPLGNKNGQKNRIWEEALRRALLAEDGKRLRSLAETLIIRAEAGDVSALKEIGDRVDGRPTQQTELSGDLRLRGLAELLADFGRNAEGRAADDS